MRVKIDENLPVDVAERFIKAGFNAETVYSEGIEGCSDMFLITLCKKERRVLVTLPFQQYKGVSTGKLQWNCCSKD